VLKLTIIRRQGTITVLGHALLGHLLHIDLMSMIGPLCLHAITTRPIDLQKLACLHYRFRSIGNSIPLVG
jgi:hypothetical protein